MRIEKGPPNRNKLLRYSEKKGGNVAGLLTSLQQGRRIKKRSWTLRDAINQTSNNDSIVITIILSPLAFSFSNPAAAAAAGSNDLNAMPSVYSSPLASLSSATRTGVRLDDEERDEKI